MIFYLDNAATTRTYPFAAESMAKVMTEDYGNPSSLHPMGLRAAALVGESRSIVAEALGCLSEELIFTSGGTESDNWALFGMAQGRRRGHIITTAVEHSAVLNSAKTLEGRGFEVTYLPPDDAGGVSAGAVEQALREDTFLVSAMMVNNETGAVTKIREIAEVLHRKGSGALLHTDAVQGFLKLPFSARDLGADLISVSGHKIGGPKGIGALYIREGVRLRPLIFGGGQEGGLRPGTEATAQIVGFAAACRYGKEHLEEHIRVMEALKAYTLERLASEVPEAKRIGWGGAPHILSISLPGYPSETLVRFLGEEGVCVSAGSACHKGKPSHVIAAMKLPPKEAKGAIRVSFCPENMREDIDAFCRALKKAKETLLPAR